MLLNFTIKSIFEICSLLPKGELTESRIQPHQSCCKVVNTEITLSYSICTCHESISACLNPYHAANMRLILMGHLFENLIVLDSILSKNIPPEICCLNFKSPIA